MGENVKVIASHLSSCRIRGGVIVWLPSSCSCPAEAASKFFGYGSGSSGDQPAPTGPTAATPHHPALPCFAGYLPLNPCTPVRTSRSFPCLLPN
ncbi:hypothetical protein SKAU_G00197520 [Synaphobranchus kaupii]|uniref:Uncharacterized protein n=1 Tax=Synaphobranchus kaupii TaxID=118154 RepID=A0A9Q1FER7_SYNKA|nr:hypothetical protein SKAU_G00197520 [Synaphobranchus kaupii]